MDVIDIVSYIKRPQIDDLDEIHQIFTDVTTWLRSMDVMQWDFSYPDKDIIRQDIISQSCLIVKVDQQIAAVVTLNKEQDPQYKNITWKGGQKDIWVIHRLAVNPKFQKRGIATQLCQYLESIATAEGAKALRLDAYSKNPYSNKMYLKLGYELRKEPLFFHGNPVHFNAYEKLIKKTY